MSNFLVLLSFSRFFKISMFLKDDTSNANNSMNDPSVPVNKKIYNMSQIKKFTLHETLP